MIGKMPVNGGPEGEGEGPERAKDDFRFGGWRILGVRGVGREGERLVTSDIWRSAEDEGRRATC